MSETQWSKRYNEVDCLDRIFQTFRKVQLLKKNKKIEISTAETFRTISGTFSET